jgi:hypothetical protein
LLLIVPSLAGGAFGSWLLLRTPVSTFERLVPWLILGATILLAVQEMITKALSRPQGGISGTTRDAHAEARGGATGDPALSLGINWKWATFVFIFQLLVGIYGGYFGAGMGILMLAALGLIGLTDLHQMNGLKNVLAVCINGVAAIYFVMASAVAWGDVAVMTGGTIVGGFIGARVARKLGRKFVRAFVVVIGIVMTVALFLK